MREGSKTEDFLFHVFITSYVGYVQCKSLERKRRQKRNKSVKTTSYWVLATIYRKNISLSFNRISFTRFSNYPWVFLFKNISPNPKSPWFSLTSKFSSPPLSHNQGLKQIYQINVRHFWFATDLTLWINTSPGHWPCNCTPNLASVSVSASVSFI